MLKIILLAITAIGLKSHVFAIPPLIQVSKKDSWMSVLLSLMITLIWILLVINIHRKTNKENIFDWLFKNLNKSFVSLILLVLVLYLSLMGGVTLRETMSWVNIALLPQTPEWLLSILFILACYTMAKSDLKTFGLINEYLLFFVVILGIFVATVNIQYKDYSLVKPFFENGYIPVFKGMVYPLSGFTELFLFLFIQHKIGGEIRYRHYAITVLILTGLTIGPLLGAISEFGQTEAAKQRFPAYEEWELVSIGHYIEHVFFFSIYQWLSGAFIRISLIIIIMKEILSRYKKHSKVFLFIMIGLIEVFTLYPISDFYYSKILFYTLLPLTAWFFIGYSLLFNILVMFGSKKSGGVNEVVQ